jgi:hypothetical protein
VPDALQVTQDGTTGVTTVDWPPSAGADHYNTYRGTIPAGGMGSAQPGPYNHTCLESADGAGDGAAVSHDADAPVAGTAFYFIVAGEDGCSEGSLGSSSAAVPRPNSLPCPTPP